MKDKIEMSFTDEDLKLLKDYAINLLREPGKLDALLARLELGEAAIKVIAEVHGDCENGECSEALALWRESKGK